MPGTNIDIYSRGFACVVLPELNYDAQLIAIRRLLRVHENVDHELDKEINALSESEKNSHGRICEYFQFEREEKLENSVYQSAAHSMSAVGMLAPLMESVFHQAFHGINEKLFANAEICINHIRWQKLDDDKWNCHIVWDKEEGKVKEDLARGIIQLSDAIGLNQFLPNDINVVLKVLFSYRNKMFHCGFEWPMEERVRFWKRIQNENWPEKWLDKATIGDKPWVIYLTSEFIQYCINTIEKVIESLGKFVISKSGIAKQSG